MRRDAIAGSALLTATFLFGGASRPDAFSQMVIRLIALGFLGAALLRMDRGRWLQCRSAVVALGLVAALMLAQLAPLPPGLWAALPGHQDYQSALQVAGLAGIWRPLSLTPDLTINSVLSLLPPFAAALTFGALHPRAWRPVLATLLILVGISALVSLVQLSTGELYLYRITNQGAGVGVFANRNHQALLLASAFPLLAAWLAIGRRHGAQAQRLRLLVAAAAAVTVFPFLLITGSRAGLIEGVIGLLLTVVLLPPRLGGDEGGWRDWAFRLAPVLAGAVVAALALGSGRDVALGRLINSGQSEIRFENLPYYFDLIWTFFPTGAGFGSFDAIYRHIEPFALLEPSYMNHVHSDPLEIAIEGGLAGWLLLAAFLLWLARSLFVVCRGRPGSTGEVLGRAGAIVTLLALVGSLADYPLRTPLAAMVFVLCCTWLRTAAAERRVTAGLAAEPA